MLRLEPCNGGFPKQTVALNIHAKKLGFLPSSMSRMNSNRNVSPQLELSQSKATKDFGSAVLGTIQLDHPKHCFSKSKRNAGKFERKHPQFLVKATLYVGDLGSRTCSLQPATDLNEKKPSGQINVSGHI